MRQEPNPSNEQPSSADVEVVAAWVEGYLHAWQTNDAEDIAALFSETAEYHETPNTTDWIGRAEIIEGWQSRWDWQQGGWEFDWRVTKARDQKAEVAGVGRYAGVGDFNNVWSITFDADNLCSSFVVVCTRR